MCFESLSKGLTLDNLRNQIRFLSYSNQFSIRGSKAKEPSHKPAYGFFQTRQFWIFFDIKSKGFPMDFFLYLSNRMASCFVAFNQSPFWIKKLLLKKRRNDSVS